MPKRENDDYYTKEHIAQECCSVVKNLVPERSRKVILEPSAGSGVFLKFIQGTEKTIAVDIQPAGPNIIKADFLTVEPASIGLPGDTSTVTVVGNPPFGFRSSLAIKFFKKCTQLANNVAFIIPLTFRKRSTHKVIDPYFHLVYDEDLPFNSFEQPDGTAYDVRCCFQIWSRMRGKRVLKKIPENIWLEFVRKDQDPDFALKRVGRSAGKVMEGLDYNEETTYFVREKIPGVKDALHNIGLTRGVANHTAGAKSISKEEILLALEEYYEAT